MKLVHRQQPPYAPIYSLGLVELKILKANIKTNLANKFIKSSKLFVNTPILLGLKLDENLGKKQIENGFSALV